MGVFREAMDQAMALRGLAPRTRLIYLSWVRRLVKHCRVAPDELTTDQVRGFLLYLTDERKLAFSTVNQALNGLDSSLSRYSDDHSSWRGFGSRDRRGGCPWS